MIAFRLQQDDVFDDSDNAQNKDRRLRRASGRITTESTLCLLIDT